MPNKGDLHLGGPTRGRGRGRGRGRCGVHEPGNGYPCCSQRWRSSRRSRSIMTTTERSRQGCAERRKSAVGTFLSFLRFFHLTCRRFLSKEHPRDEGGGLICLGNN